jgi:hypothetical protein
VSAPRLLLLRKQTLTAAVAMSASCQKRTISFAVVLQGGLAHE